MSILVVDLDQIERTAKSHWRGRNAERSMRIQIDRLKAKTHWRGRNAVCIN